VKAIAITEPTHNPIDQTYWASGLRENFTSRSYGEGLETGRKVPRQSLTRQLFFKWIKQHLRIKRFFGTSENAVKSQVWIAVSTYVLVAIARKRLNVDLSLHTMLQILSVTPFEKIPLFQLFSDTDEDPNMPHNDNQLNLL
jgi:hypothetical protein